jgi:hypothetical protein
MRGLVPGLVLAFVVPGFAGVDKPDHKKGRKKGGREEIVVVERGFARGQREQVRVYFVETHGRGKCPPGLARKNDGCLPPVQARKRYVVGRTIPPSIELLPLPPALEVRIGPPPAGYRYAVVDGDLVKLVVGTLLVVDAIDGLVP